MASSDADFPPELSTRPLQFVALTGLDIVYNAVHKAIWDLFSNNRGPDRVRISFKVLHGDHEYPKPKSKRTSYEWYIPKGILKCAWMRKHLSEIPALVVVFFDLDWEDPAWNEKLLECSARVQIARSALDCRGTKVVVVLIQQNSPLPPGEDLMATERAAALCSTCDLSARHLYVLPHSDHLLGYVLRLESALYELANNYYQQEIRSIRSHREYLSKTTHQLLFVRHQFKIAFFNEVRQDFHTALKHYKQAYANLTEAKTGDGNLFEVKTVAGYINFKICKLSFLLNTPLDAISQFRKHVDIFKTKVGPPELAFEHSAWLHKQYSMFGDIFDEAVKLGLTAIQTQHPGFYYQQAAFQAVQRKEQCRQLCKITYYPASNPLGGSASLEYFGQRPWRPGIHCIDPPDPSLERDGIMALQHREATEINHSMLIIPLLNNAITQLKKYRCTRMKRRLVVQIGEEYYDAQDYCKSLTFLTHVMWDYRQEKWWRILTSIIKSALKAAYLSASVQDYLALCVEAMGDHIMCSADEKQRIQHNFLKTTNREIPDAEPEVPESALKMAQDLWQHELVEHNDPLSFTVDMTQILGFVKCRTKFVSEATCVDRPVEVRVTLRVTCPFALRFSKLDLLFSNPVYNQLCSIDANSISDGVVNQDLLLNPNESKMFTFNFVPIPKDAGQVLEVTTTVLQLISLDRCCCLLLKWNWTSVDYSAISSDSSFNSYPELHSCDDFKTSTKIIPRESRLKITVEHYPPALENECYPITVLLVNDELATIYDVQLSIELQDGIIPVVDDTACLMLHPNQLDEHPSSHLRNIDLGSMLEGQQMKKSVFMRVFLECDRSLLIKVTYKVCHEVAGQVREFLCEKKEEIHITTVKPFSVTTKLMSMKFVEIETARSREPFLLKLEVDCISPWSLMISDSQLKLASFLKSADEHIISQIQSTVQNGDIVSECHCLIPISATKDASVIGTYSITWKRKTIEDVPLPEATTSIVLPGLLVAMAPLYISVDLPAHGWVRTPFTAVYNLFNRTNSAQDFEVTMDSSDAFMFSGNKQVHFRILPECKRVLCYNLYPLIAGSVSLPQLKVIAGDPAINVQIETLMPQMLPTHVFIMPQAKHTSDTTS